MLSVLVFASNAGPREPSSDLHACALYFFGQIKNAFPGMASYSTRVIEPVLSDHICTRLDVYFHSYRLESITNDRNHEYNVPINVTTSTQYLLSIIQAIKGIKVEKVCFSDPEDADKTLRPLDYYLERGDPSPSHPRVSMKNMLRQFHSLDMVTQLWWAKRHEYKAAIYLRPDFRFDDRLRLMKLPPPDTIMVPDFDSFRGLNDRFAIGRPDVMVVYGI